MEWRKQVRHVKYVRYAWQVEVARWILGDMTGVAGGGLRFFRVGDGWITAVFVNFVS